MQPVQLVSTLNYSIDTLNNDYPILIFPEDSTFGYMEILEKILPGFIILSERYYKKVHFPEQDCPNAVYVAKHIVNLPNYYSKLELREAKKIIDNNIEEDMDGEKA